MEISLREELSAMLQMLFCGVLCGIFRDALRLIPVLFRVASFSEKGERIAGAILKFSGSRIPPKKELFPPLKKAIYFAGDIFLAILYACIFSIALYRAASGVFRWFTFLVAVFGYFLYRISVGRIICFSAEIVAASVYTVFCGVLRLLFLPLRAGGRLVCVCCRAVKRTVWRPVYLCLKRRVRARYTEKKRHELSQLFEFERKGSDQNASVEK